MFSRNFPFIKSMYFIVVALSMLILPVSAQDSTAMQDVPLKATGVWENNLYVFGPLDALNITTDGRGNIRSIDGYGNTIAYTQFDASSILNLWVSVDMQAPFMLVTGLDSMYPVSFTPDGLLLYAMTNPNNTQPGYNYVVDLYTIAPLANAEPTPIGSFGDDVMVGVGCGGGSPLPTDWQRWQEVGFGGQQLVLKMTPYGILHSLDCAGTRTGLFNLETGEDVELGVRFGIAVISPDGTRLAGVQRDPNYTLPSKLSVVNLANQEVETYETAAIPDQVTWSADGSSLFYSVYETLETTIPMSDAERTVLSDTLIVATGDDVGGLPMYAASIRRYDLATEEDALVYQAPEDAHSIGRMFALLDKNVLVFSQVPNLHGWIAAIASGDISPNSSESQQLATVPVSVFALNLETNRLTTINVGVNLYTPEN